MAEGMDMTVRRRRTIGRHETPGVRVIQLTPEQIESALPRVERGLRKYWWLQSELPKREVVTDHEYERIFVGFYRVRRNAPWRKAFFRLLHEGRTSQPTIGEVLQQMHEATGRIEASFASKLVATLNPDLPVIDSVVLRNLGRRLPTGTLTERIHRVATLHDALAEDYARFLDTKMLDLVLWQTRDTLRSR